MNPSLLQTRQRIEAQIEDLISLLDMLDGDPDLEDGADDEPWLAGPYTPGGDDREIDHDDEPTLGWSNPDGLRTHVPEEAARMMSGWDNE